MSAFVKLVFYFGPPEPTLVAADSVESLKRHFPGRDDGVAVRTKSGAEFVVRGSLAEVAGALGFTGSLPAPSKESA